MKTTFRYLTMCLAAMLLAGCHATRLPESEKKQQEQPAPQEDTLHKTAPRQIVVILSMDAFRYDLPEIWSTPTLDSVASVGVHATIRPCFPANTFPNHYSMATGLYPDHHGIVNNNFYSYSLKASYSISNAEARAYVPFYKGEPVWNTVQRQGLHAHVYGWVGTDAAINNSYPEKNVLYDGGRSRSTLTDMVVEDLCNPDTTAVPDLIMFYFDEPDATLHNYSATSPRVGQIVESIDRQLGKMLEQLRKCCVLYDRINFIFTADHGMCELSPDRYYNIYSLVGKRIHYWYNQRPLCLEPYENYDDEVYNLLKPHERDGHYKVWRRYKVPEEYHYGKDTDRIYPILVQPDPGWTVVYDQNSNSRRPSPGEGAHGFVPEAQDMRMVFYAFGPAFKRGYEHPVEFENLNDHLIITTILGVQPADNNDCKPEDVKDLFVSE